MIQIPYEQLNTHKFDIQWAEQDKSVGFILVLWKGALHNAVGVSLLESLASMKFFDLHHNENEKKNVEQYVIIYVMNVIALYLINRYIFELWKN